jgi:hypothetical protein
MKLIDLVIRDCHKENRNNIFEDCNMAIDKPGLLQFYVKLFIDTALKDILVNMIFIGINLSPISLK